jgi:hypothetical protein
LANKALYEQYAYASNGTNKIELLNHAESDLTDEAWLPATLMRRDVTTHQQNNGSYETFGTTKSGFERYPHAGVLNLPTFLMRYTNSVTNRNRHRAKKVYKFFLGTDIELLAARSTDPVALADTNNPTLNNPACTSCHNIMDPVAGAFQNYHDSGAYRGFRSHNYQEEIQAYHALPKGYLSDVDTDGNRLYQYGDLWHRNMVPIGFNGLEMPLTEENNLNTLAWLASKLVQDPRFSVAAVQFWYQGIMGITPLVEPIISPDDLQSPVKNAAYTLKLNAYYLQQNEFRKIAKSLLAKCESQNSYGCFTLNDLLVALITSPIFTANSLINITADQSILLSQHGYSRLLTTQQLKRKMDLTLGFSYGLTHRDAALVYSGFDSRNLTERNTQMNALMMKYLYPMQGDYYSYRKYVGEALNDDVGLKLMKYVDFNALSDSEGSGGLSGVDHVGNAKQNIQHLLLILWQQEFDVDSDTVNDFYTMFYNIRRDSSNFGRNSYHKLYPWYAVMHAMVLDYRFLYE